MKVGERDLRRGEGQAISTGRMTASEAIRILQGPRQVEIERLVGDFHTEWGYVLAHHNRTVQIAAFGLFLEQRGLACLPGAPEDQVAVGDRRENENGKGE